MMSLVFFATKTIDIKEVIDAPSNFLLYNTTKVYTYKMQHEAIYTYMIYHISLWSYKI